jgi:hypothetical protein
MKLYNVILDKGTGLGVKDALYIRIFANDEKEVKQICDKQFTENVLSITAFKEGE